jgi:hypothetical protein
MNQPRGMARLNVVVGAVVAAALVVAVVVVVRSDTTGRTGRGLGQDYRYDWQDTRKTPAEWVRYREAPKIPLELSEPRALALGPDGQLFVAGDSAIHVLDAQGNRRSAIELTGPPRAVAVAADGTLYVAMKSHVEVYRPDGTRAAAWESRGATAEFTSIAVAEEDVFVGDAGSRVVLRYSTAGELLGRIGEKDPERDIPGIVVRSLHLDLVVGPDGLLWVANPGLLRVETYTARGDLEASWGVASQDIGGFCGCCNPTHLACLADGRVVTSEKGLPRVKVSSRDGVLDSVVAGPEQFDKESEGLDLAADAQGRVLVLDPIAKAVRVFERIQDEE